MQPLRFPPPPPPPAHPTSTHLSYTPAQLHALVSDINAYSSFLPYCTYSRVVRTQQPQHEHEPAEAQVLLAELGVGFGKVQERYVSRVVSVPGKSVTVSVQVPCVKG